MSVQKFIVNKESTNYTIVPNKVIQGLKDNLELLGFYLYLLSLPPNWVFHKSTLRETCGLGINKVDKFISLLVHYGLVGVVQNRNELGHFGHFDLTVYNGESFKNNDLQEHVQPFNENGAYGNGGTDLVTYKRNINKSNKEKRNIYRPSGDGHNRFLDFWKVYPRKEKKKRVMQLWSKNNLDNIADKIINAVKSRLDKDWMGKEIQYIPLPDTYLNQERWNDELNNEVKTSIKYPINSNKYPVELKSTVPVYGPGHPTWESQREWELKHGSEAGNNNFRRNGVRKVEDIILS